MSSWGSTQLLPRQLGSPTITFHLQSGETGRFLLLHLNLQDFPMEPQNFRSSWYVFFRVTEFTDP